MNQQPDFTRRRIGIAACAIALLAFSNRPDPQPVIGTIEIASSDEAPLRVRAVAAPLIAGAATFADWATKRLMR